jgi:hypothetical protein
MCAACDAVEARSEAARRLSRSLQATGLGEVLAAAMPLEKGIPYDMAALVAALDEKDGTR